MDVVLKEYQCVICHDLIASSACIIPCGDTFCFDCLYEWYKHNKNCPICRCLFRLSYCIPNKVVDNAIHAILQQDSMSQETCKEWQERLQQGNEKRKNYGNKSSSTTVTNSTTTLDNPAQSTTFQAHQNPFSFTSTNDHRIQHATTAVQSPFHPSTLTPNDTNNSAHSHLPGTAVFAQPPLFFPTNLATTGNAFGNFNSALVSTPFQNRQPSATQRTILNQPVSNPSMDMNYSFAANNTQLLSTQFPFDNQPYHNRSMHLRRRVDNDRINTEQGKYIILIDCLDY